MHSAVPRCTGKERAVYTWPTWPWWAVALKRFADARSKGAVAQAGVLGQRTWTYRPTTMPTTDEAAAAASGTTTCVGMPMVARNASGARIAKSARRSCVNGRGSSRTLFASLILDSVLVSC